MRGDVIVINIRNAELRAALLQRWVLAFCRVIILTHPNIVVTGNVTGTFPWIHPDNVTLAELSEYLLLAGKTPVEHKGITGRDRKVLYHFAMSLPPSGLNDILGLKTKSVCVLKTSIIKNYGLKGCHASALSLIMDLTGIKRPADVPSPGRHR